MSEVYPDKTPFEQELDSISSSVDRAAFGYFYNQVGKEASDILPHYSWDQFHDGIAPFNETPWAAVNDFLKLSKLVPNYDSQTVKENGLEGIIPAQHGLRGAFLESIHEQRQDEAVRVMAIHPSIATPYIIANTLNAAYLHQYGEDIRDRIFIVVGAYPMTLKYQIEVEGLGAQEIAPFDIGRMHGNLVLTAPKSANTETEDKSVQEWFNAKRAEFKLANREILSEPGNILIVHPSGTRGKKSKSKQPPLRHTEYRPDGSLDYITDVDVPTFIIGVDDNILTQPDKPASNVNVVGHPDPKRLRSSMSVINALKLSAELSGFGDNEYVLEGRVDQAYRRGLKSRLMGVSTSFQE